MNVTEHLERRVLTVSVWGAGIFSAGAITFGLVAGSQFLLFDGLYSLISVVASLMSLMASKFMAQDDWERFPFGKLAIEPLVVAVKYVMILIVIVGSAASSLISLFTGGRPIVLGIAVGYSFISTLACWAVAHYIHRQSDDSNLLRAEEGQWRMDAWISGVALAAFVGALGLKYVPGSAAILPYLDPIMVLAGSVYFVRVPLHEIGCALRELLDMAPDALLQAKVQQAVTHIEQSYGFQESYLRMSSVSRQLWIEVDFVVQPSTSMSTVADGDKIREDLSQRLKGVKGDQWLTVCFTTDRKWAQ